MERNGETIKNRESKGSISIQKAYISIIEEPKFEKHEENYLRKKNEINLRFKLETLKICSLMVIV